MTTAQEAELLKAMQPRPLIALQCGPARSQQECANEAWMRLGTEMGFDGMTVQPSSRGKRFFTAEIAKTGVKIDKSPFFVRECFADNGASDGWAVDKQHDGSTFVVCFTEQDAIRVEAVCSTLHRLISRSAAYRADRNDIAAAIRTAADSMLEISDKGADSFAREINAACNALNPTRDRDLG